MCRLMVSVLLRDGVTITFVGIDYSVSESNDTPPKSSSLLIVIVYKTWFFTASNVSICFVGEFNTFVHLEKKRSLKVIDCWLMFIVNMLQVKELVNDDSNTLKAVILMLKTRKKRPGQPKNF